MTCRLVRWIVVSSLQTCQSTSGYTTHGSRCSEMCVAACPRGARGRDHALDAQVQHPRAEVGVPEPLTRVTAGRSHTRSRRKRAYTSPLRRRQVGGGPTLERAKSTHYRHAYQHVKRPEIQLRRHRPQCRRVVLVGGGTLARSRSPRTFGAARRGAPQQISTQVTSEVNVAA